MSVTLIPQSWVACQLGDVVDYGKTVKVEPQDIPAISWVLELEDIEKDSSKIIQRISYGQRKSKSTKNYFRSGDILYGKLRPYLNKIILSDFDGYCSTEIIPIQSTCAINNQYLFFWMKNPIFLDYVSSVSHGLNMPRLGTEAGRNAPLILPPLNEQKRIADKLDAVLARVDACRERLDRVPGILKRFRQSVLAAATSGALTEEWRSNNSSKIHAQWQSNISLPPDYKRLTKQAFKLVEISYKCGDIPEVWKICTIAELYKNNILIDFADGNHGSLYPRNEDFSEEGVIFLTAAQIDDLHNIDISKCPRLKVKVAQNLTKGWTNSGDVLLTHNATVGRVGFLEDTNEKVLLGTSVTFYRFNSEYINPKFAKFVFASRFFQEQLESVMSQTTRDQVPITKQVSLHFICPSIYEQHEIVRRVEVLFAYADALEAKYRAARAQVDRLTPSLLAKAFRGELVPQDPNDEPAAELLERIRAVRAAQPAAPRARHTRTPRKVTAPTPAQPESTWPEPADMATTEAPPLSEIAAPTSSAAPATPAGTRTLADLRKAAGLNQSAVAKAMGLNQAYISQMETGKRAITEAQRDKLAEILGVTVKDLP